MGIVKDPLSFTRFRVDGELPQNFNGVFNEMIRRFAFQSSFHAEKVSGWTSVDNLLDTKFEYANYAIGDYFVFSMRVDKKAIPASLLKVRCLEEERKVKAGSGRKFLPRQTREDLKEKVRLELSAIIPPVPSFFEACWSLSGKTVYFCSLSPSAIGEFKDLFKRSFNLELDQSFPWHNAAPDSGSQVMDSAEPSPGRDFLNWLWFKSEERNGKISLAGGDAEVIFLKRMVLESGQGDYSESVVCQGLNAELEEGREALRKGKKIREARIRLAEGENSWEFTLKADQFLFQSMRMPRVLEMEEESDRDGRLLERIALMEMAAGTIDELFGKYRSDIGKDSSRFERWLARK